MHPDLAGFIVELHAHFREILVKGLSPEQLQLHDYFSTRDPLYSGEDCFDEFPLVDGLPELIRSTEMEEDNDGKEARLPREAQLQERKELPEEPGLFSSLETERRSIRMPGIQGNKDDQPGQAAAHY